MRARRPIYRAWMTLAAGSCLLQFTGCLTAAVPGLVSVMESTLLSVMFQGLFSR